ncbi:MAG: hypothetical protein K8T20_08870 [Planctomycetes bacterium]|nr:hypothetical protein [Planctomycetota bacterium]
MSEEIPNEQPGGQAAQVPPPAGLRFVRAIYRVPILALGIVFLLFPHPRRALREIRMLRDPNALIAPGDSAVAKLSAEVDANMPKGLDRPKQIAWIEGFIENRIVYTNDWDQWLNVDYWPTPTETMATGHEDCDGIAVVAASLLKHRGFSPRIQASYEHVWLEVEGEKILHPDKETDFDGEHWSLPGLKILLPWARYSLSAFPLWRWGTLVAWAILVLRWPNRPRAVLEFAAIFIALAFASLAARQMPDALFAVVLLAALALTVWTVFRRSRPPAAPSPGGPA